MSPEQSVSRAFVGRRRELTELHAGLDDAVGGRGRVVLIVGDPGIGKTRLAEEVADAATRRGARACWGRCWEGGGAPVYWPWVQILRTLGKANAEPRLSNPGAGAEYIAQLMPESHAAENGDTAEARFPLFDAVTTFLKRTATEQPLVILLDDLHAADQPSLLLLQFLARELRDARMLVVGTYRDVEVQRQPESARLLSDVARNGCRLPLGGLSEPDVAAFIGTILAQAPTADLVTAVHRTTEGSPFFVDELVRVMMASEAVRVGAGLPIPHGVRDAIREHLRPLSVGCRRVIALAAVIGREFDLACLQGASALATPEVLALLDEASAGGVITAVPARLGRYSFKHGLIRDTLYEDLPAPERMRLHRQIGTVLEGLCGADPEPRIAELAHHFRHAAPAGDVERAIDYSVRAARRALTVLAYEEAVAHYAAALQVLALAPQSDEPRRLRLLLALGEAQARASDTAGAHETFRRAAELAHRLGMAEARARAALGFGGAGFGVPRDGAVDPELLGLLEEASAALGPHDSALKARVLARSAVELYFSADVARRTALSKEAIDMARRVGDATTSAYVVSARHFAIWDSPDVEDRLALATEAVELAERAGARDLAMQAHVWRMLDVVELGDHAEWEGELDVIAMLADSLRQPRGLSLAATLRAMRALWRGEFDYAGVLMEQAPHSGNRGGDRSAVVNTSVQMFVMRRARGEQSALVPVVQGWKQQFPASPIPRSMLALLYADLEDAAAARHEFESLAAYGFPDIERVNALRGSLPWLVEVCTFLGDTARAAVLQGHLLPLATRNLLDSPRLCFGPAAHFLGLISATMEEWDEAARYFDNALVSSARLGGRPAVAGTQCEYARLLVKRARPGDRERAADLLTQAEATARALGLRLLAERVDQVVQHAPAARSVTREEAPAAEESERAVANARRNGSGRVLHFSGQHRPRAAERDAASVRTQGTPEPLGSATSCSAVPAPQAGVFRQEGEYWTVGDNTGVLRLRNTKGLRYIAWLLRHPNREFHVTDLAAETIAAPEAPVHLDRFSEEQLGRQGLHAAAAEPGESLLDRRAKGAYRRRLEDLRDQLDEATRFNDIERASQSRAEIEFLTQELARAVGLGGRDRKTAGHAERARLNVTRAIKAVIKRLAAQHPQLGRYLSTTIKTGAFCSYVPDSRLPIIWKL